MRTCLNLVTLQRGLDTIEGVRIAAAAGFEGVGIWVDVLEKQPSPLEYAKEVAKAVADAGLRVEEMCYVGGWMWAEGEARNTALDTIKRRTELGAAAGCPLIIACASGGTGSPQVAADDYRAVCDIGAQFGICFALEYIGPFPQIKDIPSGLQVVRLADHANGKLLIDIFHSFRGGTVLADFDIPQGNEVGLVHINDVPEGHIMQMDDSHRVMPGDGVLPLKECLAKLAAHGCDGALSVEVFNPEWWSKPLDEIARGAREGLGRVMG